MKKQFKFFSALFAAAAMMASCSNDEPVNPGTPGEEGEFSDQYLSVSLMMPTSIGGRAYTGDEDGNYKKDPMDNFDDGTEAESKVGNIVFFFFDENDNCIDIQKLDSPKFEDDKTNNNPYVTSIGTKEVRLKSGLHYNQVAVALNSNESVSSLRLAVKDLTTLMERSKDYTKQIGTDGSNQMMSNSVYFTTTNGTKPTEDARVVLVKITDKNIYDSKTKSTLGQDGGKEYVNIYVERAAARIDVSMSSSITNGYYVGQDEDGNDTNKLKLYNNTTYSTEEVIVVPVIEGMMLDVLTPEAKLVKPLNLDAMVGYANATDYTAFQWNDFTNRRSYWATTSDVLDGMKYFSWDAMAAKGTTSFSQYINPNTQDFIPDINNEDLSKNTKVVVAATLKYKKEGQTDEEAQPLDLVRYGSEHMFAENLLAQTASITNAAIRGINWNEVKDNNENDPITFTDAEKVILSVAVNNSFLGISNNENGLKGNQFDIDHSETSNEEDRDEVPYEAKVVTADGFNFEIKFDASLYNDYNDDAVQALVAAYSEEGSTAWKELTEKAAPFIEKVIESSLNDVNNQRIIYWKGGKTYFYHVIRHQGFYGLVGDRANNYLFGVVRNHIYKVSLNKLYGLGTPVIDPGEPIDPERPKDETPSYITAKINILPWRVVENNATIH